MRTKLAWTLVLVAASIAAAAPAGGQSVQYRSAAGVEYRSQRDTGAIARAESALADDPRHVERIIQLGLAPLPEASWPARPTGCGCRCRVPGGRPRRKRCWTAALTRFPLRTRTPNACGCIAGRSAPTT